MEITDNYHALHALDEFKMALPDGGARTVLPEEHPLAQKFLAFSGNALVCIPSTSSLNITILNILDQWRGYVLYLIKFYGSWTDERWRYTVLLSSPALFKHGI
jgi:hypothetical protein